MASNGIIQNDKTGEIMALIRTEGGTVFVDADGKKYIGGKPGGWTMLKHKEVPILSVSRAVSDEIAKVPSKDVYGSVDDVNFKTQPVDGGEIVKTP